LSPGERRPNTSAEAVSCAPILNTSRRRPLHPAHPYADLSAAEGASGVEVISIDGSTATREAMADGRCRFWIVEHFHTCGRGR
jgi:hypothetical protein